MKRVIVALALLAGCKVDAGANGARTCAVKADCGAGEECYRGYCIPTSCDDGLVVECYSGDIITRGVGRCKAGTQTCLDGRFGACAGEILPLSEDICGNGIDDNCDDDTDEFDSVCQTGLLGVCANGHRTSCNGACEQDTLSSVETCNNEDDDCNGMRDDAIMEPCYPASTSGCVPDGSGGFNCTGACATGVRTCTAGMMGECEGAHVPNMDPDGCTAPGMTAVDDDCDGPIDEDCECNLGEMQDCYSGTPGTELIAPCHVGHQNCEMTASGPRFGACLDERSDEPETCLNEGEDDDCDMMPDDLVGRDLQCEDMMQMGVCKNGRLGCAGAVDLTCITTSSSAEVCNTLDDDCDGDPDEDFDLSSDPLNCGGCNAPCTGGTQCCMGSCTSTATDINHCGNCTTACTAPGEDCCGGACEQTRTSTSHCGTCGRSCPNGQECCSGSCVDTRTDEANCNGCGITCGLSCCNGQCTDEGSSACQGCMPACSGAGEQCCTGTCVQTQNNPLSCGGCSTVCSGGTPLCCGSACFAEDAQHCGASCTNCGPGSLCCDSACVPSNGSNCNACDNVCGSGTTCCPDPGGGCFDLMTDRNHCNSCVTQCGTGQNCYEGACCRAADLCGGRCCFGLCVAGLCV